MFIFFVFSYFYIVYIYIHVPWYNRYIYIENKICSKKLIIGFDENMLPPHEINCLLRKDDCFVRKYNFSKNIFIWLENMIFRSTIWTFRRKRIICFGNMICSFNNMPKRHPNGMNYFVLNVGEAVTNIVSPRGGP